MFLLSSEAGKWQETILHNFTGQNGQGPDAVLTMDGKGGFFQQHRLRRRIKAPFFNCFRNASFHYCEIYCQAGSILVVPATSRLRFLHSMHIPESPGESVRQPDVAYR